MRKLDKMYLKAKQMVTNFFYDEQGDVNIVSMIVLMGVAVILALVFKDKLTIIIEKLTGSVSEQADKAIKGTN